MQPRSILVPRARLMRRSEDHESREAHPLFKPSCQIVAGECRTVCPLSCVLGSTVHGTARVSLGGASATFPIVRQKVWRRGKEETP